MENNSKWVQTWGQAHAALSFFAYPSSKKTYRMIINTAISGKKLRIKLGNAYGKDDVVIGSVTCAPCNSFGSASSDFKKLKFYEKESFTLLRGERAVSDDIDFPIEVGSYFCINIYVEKGRLTSGNLLNNIELLTADGDYSQKKFFPNEPRKRDGVITAASKILGMKFHKPVPLFESVELLNDDGASAIVVFGDSISQQGFWTNPFEKRIREAFPGKYSVINKSIMGNRILRDYWIGFPAKGLYGIRAIKRIEDDVFAYEGISHVIMSEGINDIFQYSSISAPSKEKPDIGEMCAAIERMAKSVKNKGIRFIPFNIIPFGAAPDSTVEKDKLRREVNAWYDSHKDEFDGFFDWSASASDPDNDYFCTKEYIGSDGLHPNAIGGKIFADAIDLKMFE